MLEHRLREFWFFRLLGAFSINQQSPKGIIETLSYTISILTSPNTVPLVVMFPQGELRPSAVRPLAYNRGVERVLAKVRQYRSPLAVVPLAMRCEFLAEERPFVFLECGTPHIFLPTEENTETNDVLPSAQLLEQKTEILLKQLEQRIIAGERGIGIL